MISTLSFRPGILRDRVVLIDPILHGCDGVVRGAIADDHLFDACVDDQAPAHGTAGGVLKQLAGLGVPPCQIERGAQGLAAGGGDDGVCLGMDAAAQLIPLAGGDAQLLPGTAAQIDAVAPSSGRTVISGGDDLVVLDDDGAVVPAEAGGTFQHCLSNVQIVVLLVHTAHCHGRSLRFFIDYVQYKGFFPPMQ